MEVICNFGESIFSIDFGKRSDGTRSKKMGGEAMEMECRLPPRSLVKGKKKCAIARSMWD